jgi:NADPH2:quinone reductase
VLVPQERDTPQPKAGEMLVKVAAAGVNRPDVMQREGKYPPPPGAPDIPGLELAGEVVRSAKASPAGRSATRSPRWSRAAATRSTRSCTRRFRCRSSHSSRWSRPAPFPETFFTVWHNVFERGALKAGETMLLHGGSSGIGTTAIMLAKCHGARVIVTVGSEEKAEACRKLGADVAINYKTEDFVAETKKATGGKGAEVIIDMVAGDYIQKNYDAAAMDGRIVQIAFQRPPKAMVDFRPS